MGSNILPNIKEAIDSCDRDRIQSYIINVVDIFEKAATLIYAVKCSSSNSVQILLDAGCDPCLRYVDNSNNNGL